MRICLTAKYLEGNLYVIDKPECATHKTKPLAHALKNYWKFYDQEKDIWKRVAFICATDELDSNLALAARNLQYVDFFPAYAANTWDVVRREVVMITKAGLQELEEKYLSRVRASQKRITFLPGAPEKPKTTGGLPKLVPKLTKYDRRMKFYPDHVPHWKKYVPARPWFYKGGDPNAPKEAEATAE